VEEPGAAVDGRLAGALDAVKFCNSCGGELVLALPPHDTRERHVCTACSTVHYENPRVVAGCIPEWQGRILLCKRSIEPRAGLWNLPAGFMETGETVAETALRETGEEANARVELLGLYSIMNLPHISQVYFMFRARLLDPDFSPGHETADARLFGPAEIPWGELAFPTVQHTLRFYLDDLDSGNYRFRMGDIVRDGGTFDYRPSSASDHRG
jgi:ADP-ribose pyrophosphatase YjhB (NUDIX family)